MASTVVARRYARALFEAARDASALEPVARQLGAFAGILEQSPELRSVLSTPALPLDERQQLLRSVLEKGGAHKITVNTLLLLTERGRLNVLEEITEAFREEADRAAGRVRARVASATALSPQQVDAVKAALEQASGKRVVVDASVDPDLIGGVVAHVGGVVYDGSLKSELRRLRHAIAQERAGAAA